MHKYTFALLTLVGSLLFSCQSSTETSTPAAEADAPAVAEAGPELRLRSERIQRQSDLCQADTCAKVDIQYLVAEGGPTALRDSVNQYVRRYLLRQQLTNNPDANLTQPGNPAELTAQEFLLQYASSRKEFPEAATNMGWQLTISSEALHQTPALVSLKLTSVGYSGGAHGYAVTTLQSFDSTGHALQVQEMVTDTVQLRKLVEQEFREVRKLGKESLEQQGFYTQAGHLPFPQNAALTPKGLHLYYNAYEVNAYAFGPTDILLPYAQISSLLKPVYQPQP
ncbi:DUF3298 domain-containing protein [Rufibacter sediminis]|uniref:DUF4163 domain-containing protein n=1 Tax=Rufibacter sediminis TaxID=2762756 RepID=A0ABR6VUX0_9BACT|nr:DUF3298 and DUF4163 domain-containing protein [Rufibacter sediminis]MBC3540699.1 DUF4163 domain-containing protein [Rufibacter sediminis]